MRILILGGTKFIGRHIVETLLASGHRVSIFTRGQSTDELPAEVERLRGDRDEGPAGLKALDGHTWDVCVDMCGYTARQVRPSAEKLRSVVKRYVYVSTVSVYGEPMDRPVRETHARMQPASEDTVEVTGETYGPLKVACENIVQEIYPDRCTVLRPQIVAGPHDPTGRYTYWVQRAKQGGEMLAPGDGSDHLQVIDVRDIARFSRLAIETNLNGIFNLAGPRFTWAEFMKILDARESIWVASETINSIGVSEFELPLFRPEGGRYSGLMDVSNERALSAGLTLTDPKITARDVRTWLSEKEIAPLFLPEREAELIRLSRGAGAHSK